MIIGQFLRWKTTQVFYCPVLSCSVLSWAQDEHQIIALSCRTPGHTFTGHQDRTGHEKLSCARLWYKCKNLKKKRIYESLLTERTSLIIFYDNNSQPKYQDESILKQKLVCSLQKPLMQSNIFHGKKGIRLVSISMILSVDAFVTICVLIFWK